jgi:signal transduction histidine kinase
MRKRPHVIKWAVFTAINLSFKRQSRLVFLLTLQKINVMLQSEPVDDDQHNAMQRLPADRSHALDTRGSVDRRAEQYVSVGQLAHELNSLLDGSLRSLSLVRESLGEADASERASRIRSVHETLQQIAQLLSRAMTGQTPKLALFDDPQPLEAKVQQIVEQLTPLTIEHHVQLAVDLTPRCRKLRSGTLGPVILNGLRNAIEACAAWCGRDRRVDLSIAIDSRHEDLVMTIADTGVGLPVNGEVGTPNPGSHGIGLELSRQIVAGLNGELVLRNIPFGGGAILQVIVPTRSLTRS